MNVARASGKFLLLLNSRRWLSAAGRRFTPTKRSSGVSKASLDAEGRSCLLKAYSRSVGVCAPPTGHSCHSATAWARLTVRSERVSVCPLAGKASQARGHMPPRFPDAERGSDPSSLRLR